jgi:hypothetical protein
VREELERIEIPGAAEAEERAAVITGAAFDSRRVQPRRATRFVRPALAAVVLAAAAATVLTPPGRAVIDRVRRTVGVAHAQPALFRLPAAGRLLVRSDAGVWVVAPDGARRLLGPFREASWSPFGRYLVAAKQNELAAVEPDGTVRWSLARPDVRLPRWTGTPTDTRIAYLTGSRLHVVAGDGKGDVDAGGLQAAANVAPAWRPGKRFVLAYVDTLQRVTAYDPIRGAVLFRTPPLAHPRELGWSRGGTLLVVTDGGLVVYGSGGRRLHRAALAGIRSAAFAPDGRRIAVLRRSEVLLVDVAGRTQRRVFASAGPLEGLSWSPDGSWLVVGWPAADQWLFLGTGTRHAAVPVANVSDQFRSQTFPRVGAWCCSQ